MKATPVSEFGPLVLVRLGRSDWRVSSGAEPDNLLGYIERQRGGRFEVMWMTDPMRWGYADSFDAALLAFADSIHFTGETFDRRAQVVGVRHGTVVTPPKRTSWIKPRGRTSAA
jgi:hypothetical protein